MSSETAALPRTSYARDTLRSRPLAAYAASGVQFALAIIFVWFGLLKFTDYEASAIAPLVMNNPLTSWMIGTFGVAGAAEVLGVFEVIAGLLLAARIVKPLLGVIGGAMAAVTFLVTLSFMLTTPGVAQPGLGHSVLLSAMPGQFLLKDLVLLAVSAWGLTASFEDYRLQP